MVLTSLHSHAALLHVDPLQNQSQKLLHLEPDVHHLEDKGMGAE